MNAYGKAVVGLLLQGALVAMGIYVGVSEEAFPGASTLGRMALAALFVGVGMLFGEVQRVRGHMSLVLQALQGAIGSSPSKDPRRAVDVLVAALDSPDPHVRETAHRNLVRLTKQTFPPDAGAWRAWWEKARAGFPGSGAPSA